MAPEQTKQLADLQAQLKVLNDKKAKGEQLTPAEETTFASLTKQIAVIEKEG